MGIAEQLLSGNTYTRVTQLFEKAGGLNSASNSTQAFNSAFIVLSATANRPSVLRLYSDESSLYIDAKRPLNNFNVSESVGLVADITFTSAGTVTFVPPLIGTTVTGGELWWYLTSSNALAQVSVQAYPIAPYGLPIGSALSISGSNISTTSNGVSGSISTPNGYLIISGSATTESRLRLYSTPLSEIPSGEFTRSFGTASLPNANLIADLMFDSASFKYKLVPVLEAYTWKNNAYVNGTNLTSYILENKSLTTPANITASLYIYSFQD